VRIIFFFQTSLILGKDLPAPKGFIGSHTWEIDPKPLGVNVVTIKYYLFLHFTLDKSNETLHIPPPISFFFNF